MKLSTRVRYGTRAMLDLACHYGDGPVLLKDVAKRQDISVKYLDRIISSLKSAGLVKSQRGAKGGYSLSSAPQNITLSGIVEAIDGPINLVECARDKNYCNRVNSCVTHDIWCELGKAMELTLKNTTLENLVIRDRLKRKSMQEMYHI
jgi:Rrf2 family protein